MTISSTIIADSDAARELQELNALHLDLALTQARIDAAIERLIDADAETLRVFTIDDRANVLTGNRMHVLLEEWHGGHSKTKYSAHSADSCPGHWCHADGEPRWFGRDKDITFAFRGEWILAGWDGGHGILVKEASA